ncbi:RdgB/HAM1 family non-canonical purine NTP pyrophosphatase [Janibacter alkaliphilus]|uniref:dITP/XTP pyrophosphatase n=1 Tax=Janibacter alkaliphilus TaxID=1069963 RepID=A0A852X6L3_9MICO|nr:RdgB/HAM1 family non-canonical purine NTP pyrophosphatase [Janibacter alkaliphilus]NYG38636.1 XTP/dITP diphosphohydrolase [Janibacter alkaliphilus]
MPRQVVLATHNEHKVHELQQILGGAGLDLEVLTMSAFPEVADVAETEVSFAGNATLKAAAVAAATGLPALADDSGLSVDVLGGSPGIFSARWSGRHGGAELSRAEKDARNLQLLLDQLADVPDAHRGGAFRCAAALVAPGEEPVVVEGRLDGVIGGAPAGENGFGYDPVFVPEGRQRTLAEHSDEEKNAISHRGRAFRAMVPHLQTLV